MATLTYIENATQMTNELNKILETVIENVSQKLLKDFKDHLDETIYASPTGEYERYYDHRGFYSGWDIEKADKLTRTLFFDGNKLISPSEDKRNNHMAHGGNGEDIRNIMDAILNVSWFNYEYSYTGGANYLKRDEFGAGKGYWDSYMPVIDDRITKWLDEEFKKYGISRKG